MEWRAANRDRERDRNRRWAAANADKVRESSRRQYAANPNRTRLRVTKWRQANPERRREQEARRRARELAAYVAPVTAADIARMMDRQHGRCAAPWCDAPLADGYHVDHVIPLTKGGTHEPGNVQLLCPTCNMSKGAKMPETFARERGRLF